LADLGYCGIKSSIPEAILLNKKPRSGKLTPRQKFYNKRRSSDRVIVENFFGRWKTLFGVIGDEFRGSRKSLCKIVPITIGLTNWYIERHPLRAAQQAEATDSEDEENEIPIEFVDSSSE
jgi:hypothetical protein